ncbi:MULTISPECIES: hypothetical protein [Acinetobacter]|jgi:hypothetical protein|uniref:Uncharacterized protein n=1 Tax=Acinetobacter stercoris TaxID=2126983 RepID=A0A2U3N440_9GAMM|nr:MULTISPECIES: hypothetical protein [Acinetobacter]MCH4243738.1 hypothetical protein [Acinetobacter gerneri]SPL72457.1 hypothetical protein KPC_3635 [Acinetobacter stercoris]
MSEIYKYRYTQIGIFGSLPTYKVFTSSDSEKVKWVFADNSFIYGFVSDWALSHSGLDSGKPTWSEEPKLFLETEKRRLSLYRASHPDFITQS